LFPTDISLFSLKCDNRENNEISVGNNLGYSYHKSQRFLFSSCLKLGVRLSCHFQLQNWGQLLSPLDKTGVFLNVTPCILVPTYHTSECQM